MSILPSPAPSGAWVGVLMQAACGAMAAAVATLKSGRLPGLLGGDLALQA